MKRYPLFLLATLMLVPLSACSPAAEESSEVSVIKVTSVSLNESSKTLEGGETFQLVATVLPENATNKSVKYISSKPSVATVDSTGLVSALTSGNTVISVITNDGNRFAQCKITVISNGIVPTETEIKK